MGVKLGIS